MTLKIKQLNQDSKKLHQLINNLTRSKAINLMPEGSDEDAVNSFANFFNDKVLNIRKIAPLNIKHASIPQFRKFSPFTEKECEAIVNNLKAKSFKLDPIPSVLLKRMLPVVNPVLTAIVNKSLGEGKFCRDWKTAIACPLVKKQGLENTNQNYRPVSNLGFISKLVQKTMLVQFNDHCQENDLNLLINLLIMLIIAWKRLFSRW